MFNNFVMPLPRWIFSWHTFLIILGFFIGLKHGFRGPGWFIMMAIGAFFTLKDVAPFWGDIDRIFWPSVLVLLGLFIIFKPKANYCAHRKRWHQRQDRWRRRQQRWVQESNPAFGFERAQPAGSSNADYESRNDYLDSVNVFGGSHQIVYSKNFKGGDVVAVFGGCDVNLTQSDFTGEIVLEVVAVFGGSKIIIPQSWVVKHEITAILGGVDDKRAIMPLPEGAPEKILIIRGLAMFGGIEIKNY